ncbi:MAG: hypothetical protein OEY59_03460 [Deltaproteobacteria bacterium]|nr:hypothetical protein [Deltaproteobacteria bacterium]
MKTYHWFLLFTLAIFFGLPSPILVEAADVLVQVGGSSSEFGAKRTHESGQEMWIHGNNSAPFYAIGFSSSTLGMGNFGLRGAFMIGSLISYQERWYDGDSVEKNFSAINYLIVGGILSYPKLEMQKGSYFTEIGLMGTYMDVHYCQEKIQSGAQQWPCELTHETSNTTDKDSAGFSFNMGYGFLNDNRIYVETYYFPKLIGQQTQTELRLSQFRLVFEFMM